MLSLRLQAQLVHLANVGMVDDVDAGKVVCQHTVATRVVQSNDFNYHTTYVLKTPCPIKVPQSSHMTLQTFNQNAQLISHGLTNQIHIATHTSIQNA